jgi:hypothetical protein
VRRRTGAGADEASVELILLEMPDEGDPERDVKREAVTAAILAFVERFPT